MGYQIAAVIATPATVGFIFKWFSISLQIKTEVERGIFNENEFVYELHF